MVSYVYCSYETDKGDEGLMYIGSRKCPKGRTPETDNYFGSQKSKKNKDFKNNPNKDKIILATFETYKEALAYEIELHDLLDVGRSPMFANQCKATSTGFSREGIKMEPETREKIAEFNRGKKRGPETCRKISENRKHLTREKHPMFGKNHKSESCQKMSENHADFRGEKHPMFGKKHKPESIQKMKENVPDYTGNKNPSFDHTLYDFENKELGVLELQITRYEMSVKYDLYSSHLGRVVRGKSRHHKGWSLA